jgi:hypothetical protein
MSDKLREQAEERRILEIRHGSHLYGTNTPESDEDFVGIFMPPTDYVFGLKSVQEIDLSTVSKGADDRNTAEAIDRKLYEFRKFLRLCLDNNPNILEILFVNDENVVFTDKRIGNYLRKLRHQFPSKRCIPKFIGYSHSQKHKMIIKRDHYSELLEGYKVMEVTEDKLTMGQLYDRMVDSFDHKNLFIKKGTGMHIHIGDICFEPGVYVKKARRKLKKRIDKATNRSELILDHGFDTKFGSHLIRLLLEGKELLETGEIQFPLKDRELLLDIKTGKLDLKEVLELADQIENQIDELKEKSELRQTPNYDKVEEFCVSTMILFMFKPNVGSGLL